MTGHFSSSLVWLRRDLRLHDHAALNAALADGAPVQAVFVFDTDILNRFPDPQDRRLRFIAHRLCQMEQKLQQYGGGLLVLHGSAKHIIPTLAEVLKPNAIHAGEDYEPSARARDAAVMKALPQIFHRHKDHVIMAPDEVVKDGDAYKVFTPYSKKWRDALTPSAFAPYPVKLKGRLADCKAAAKKAEESGLKRVPTHSPNAMLEAIGYRDSEEPLWNVDDVQQRLKQFLSHHISGYTESRNMLADEDGTSRLSPYLRFGLLSIREVAGAAMDKGGAGAQKWLSELIWREFYAMILYHYPDSAQQEWQVQYRGLDWRQDKAAFQRWCEGQTGYPVVDAAMRQLLCDGWMHNRARMIVASFLIKDLLIDWRLGEEHFAQYLMDYEQASNVGGWQWAASTGTDAQPYFRIFNPVLQSQKFDPEGEYIRRYVPELAGLDAKTIHEPWKMGEVKGYPTPMVDHKAARAKALEMFKKSRGA